MTYTYTVTENRACFVTMPRIAAWVALMTLCVLANAHEFGIVTITPGDDKTFPKKGMWAKVHYDCRVRINACPSVAGRMVHIRACSLKTERLLIARGNVASRFW